MDPKGSKEKGELEEDSYKILSQFYKEKKDLLYHTADGVVACKRKDEEKILPKHNLIILPQLYQTEVLFRSHDQMGHQGIDKVQQRILHRFDWPGLRKACERWVNACLAFLQVKDPRKMKFPLKSVEIPTQVGLERIQGRFYRLSTGRAAHYENLKPHIPSPEDWCVTKDMEGLEYLLVEPACDVNEKGTRDKK